MLSASLLVLVASKAVAAAPNETTRTNALAYAAVAAANSSSSSYSSSTSLASQQEYITMCSYATLSKSKTWPGVDSVCSSSTQNSCIRDPSLPVGLCQWGSNFLGSKKSRQILHNDTHFWTMIYDDSSSRDKHCQEGTEIPIEKWPQKFLQFPRGAFSTCMAQYPGPDGTLNPDWQEPSNFCSTHGNKVFNVRDAKECVGYATHTSQGKRVCPDANSHETSIKTICGGSSWDDGPLCGCFSGYKYFL